MTVSRWNVPNALSAFRIAAAPVLLVLAWNQRMGAFLVLFALALASDVLDGVIARRFGLVSGFGARLDQRADFALWGVTPIAAWWLWPDTVWREAPYVALALAGLLVPNVLAYWKYGEVPGYHTWTAKLCAVAMGLGVPLLLLFDVAFPFRAAAWLMVVAAVDQLGITWLLPESRSDVSSVFHARRAARG